MAVGGSVNSEGEYVNIIGGKTDGIASVKISDGITAVMPCAFNGITSLTSLELPATLERIYRKAFFGCKNIDGTLVLPDRLINIGALAFYNCTALKGDLVIPGGVKTVDYAAFCNCKGFDGALVLKNGVEETGGLAFAAESGSMGFTALELSDSLKKIGYYSFQNCKKIKGELQLPEGLETISDGAFDHMTGLENEVLVIPSTVKVIGGDYNVAENTGYGGHVFYDMGQDALFKEFSVADGNEYFRAEDGVLYSADKKRIIGYPRGKTDTVFELPEGLVQIDELSFSRAAYLQKLILPDSYVINRDVPANILNQDANSLSAGLYVYTSVNELAVKDTNPNYTAENGLLYSKDKKTLWYIPTNKQGAADISNECVKIEKGAVFLAPKAYNHWSGVIIPPSVTEIDEYSMDYLNSRYSGLITVYNNDVYTAANGSVKAREYTAGDADMSGARNSTDTAILLKYIMQETGFAFNEEAADVSGDGKINVLDAILLEEKLA